MIRLRFLRDDDLASSFCDLLRQLIGVVALIGDRDVGFEAVDKLVRKGDIVALPW